MTNKYSVMSVCVSIADSMGVASDEVEAQAMRTITVLDDELEYPSDSNSGNQNYLNMAKKHGKGKR